MSLEVIGVEGWTEVLASVGLDDDLATEDVYPDEQTLALVEAFAGRAHLSVADALRAFGRYWISYADKSAHGAIMRMSGESLGEFLANLDRMHAAIQVAMPNTNMPSFRLLANASHALEVEYVSDREGLQPFVLGLLEGLMDRFKQPGVVNWRDQEGRKIFSIHFADCAHERT